MVRVNLYIYDISKGMAGQLSFPLLGKQIDGVWHTSIVCFDMEYFFGSDGITHCAPCGTILGAPDETVCLGDTNVTKNVFHEYLSGLSKESFRGERYHLFNHNCNTFSNELATFLTGKKIPSYITDLPQEVISTPFGAMIGQFFDNVRIQPQSGNGSNFTESNEDEWNGMERYIDNELTDESPTHQKLDRSDTLDSTTSNTELSLPLKTYPVDEELLDHVNHLKRQYESCSSSLDKLRDMIEESNQEEEQRKEITETFHWLCNKLQSSSDENLDSFKSLLEVLKATALNLPRLFKYAEGDDVILQVINKTQRGNYNDVKLLRLHLLTNLLSVYELRNHLLEIQSLLRTVVTLTVSSVLDGPSDTIREAGCCLAYSLSVVNLNEDHCFELSSALLHAVCNLIKDTDARRYCIEALKKFIGKSEQIAELASMIVPDVYESELKTTLS